MKTLTGVAPRPLGEANLIIVPAAHFRWMAPLLMLSMWLCSDTAGFAQTPLAQTNGERMKLLAQTQRAAAESEANQAPASAPAPAETTPPKPADENVNEAAEDNKAPAAEVDAKPDATAPATADGDATAAMDAIAAMAAEAEENSAPNADANANPDAAAAATPATPAPNTDGTATPAPGAGGRPAFGSGGGSGRPGFGPGGGGVAAQTAAGGLVQGPGGRVTLQFPLNPVSDLLNIYERLIAKTIVKDTTVFDGPQVSLVTPTDVDRAEAIRLIEATLLVNGYVIVAEPDRNSVKVLFGGQRQGGQSASFSEGIVIYTDENPLPAGETLIGYFMELEYISSETAATLFGNHVVLNEFGRITPVTTPSGLLITESSSIIRQLIQLKTIIDVSAEEAPLLTQFVQLEYAESNVVAQIIQAAMDARMEERQRQSESGKTISGQSNKGGSDQPKQAQPQATQARTTFVRTADGRMVAQAGSASNGIGTADMPAAQLIPDDRLNRIMVVAAPTDLAYVLDMIAEFDKPLSNPDPVEIPLNYIKANDILPVIVDVLQDTGTGQTQLPGGRQIDTRPTPVTSSQLATLTGVNQGGQNNQNRTNQTGATTGEVGGRTDQIAFPIDEVAPISVLVGKTRLIADRQSNVIIVIGSKENQQIVLDIIDRLDQKPMQVYLATVIGELTLSDDTEFGVDYLQKFIQFSGDNPADGGIASSLINGRTDIIGPTNTTGNISDLRDNIITTAFGPAAGLNVYGEIGESLDVIVTALQANQNFKILSRPVVYTQNGKRAEITSGQEVPYPESSLSDTTNVNSVRSTVAYKDVVLKLEVLPTINEANEVTLDIVQINDRVVGEQLVDQNLIPIIGKQELNTTVTIPNMSTIVLGGLISERDDLSDSGVPFLKNIPLIGHAVKNTTSSKIRSELMIFIQPIVVRDDQDAFVASRDEDVRSEIGEDAAEIFPEPGLPTEQFEAEEQEMVVEEEKRGIIGRIGRSLFGGKNRK